MAIAPETPIVYRTRRLCAAVEGTPGTAATLDDASSSFIVINPRITPQFRLEQRQSQGGFAMHPAQLVNKLGQLVFDSHLYGGSAQPAWAEVFLPSVGLAFSSTKYLFSPVPPVVSGATAKTITAAVHMARGSLKRHIFGAMGNLKLALPSGGLALGSWEYTGVWGTPADAAVPTPTYPSSVPLKVVSSAVTIGSWTPKVASISLDLGAKIVVREDSSTATGYHSAMIGDFLPTGELLVEASNATHKDTFAEFVASTEASFSAALHAGDDDATIVATKLQITGVDEQDGDGRQMWNIKFQLNAADLEITFT